MITRELLLGTTKRRYALVPLPFGLPKARIQSLTEAEKSRFESAVFNAKVEVNVSRMELQRRRLIIACLVDNDGNRLLSDADMPALEAMDGAVSHVLYTECRKHCGFEAGEIEELVKNSESIPVSESAID